MYIYTTHTHIHRYTYKEKKDSFGWGLSLAHCIYHPNISHQSLLKSLVMGIKLNTWKFFSSPIFLWFLLMTFIILAKSFHRKYSFFYIMKGKLTFKKGYNFLVFNTPSTAVTQLMAHQSKQKKNIFFFFIRTKNSR